MQIHYPAWPSRPDIRDGVPALVWEGLMTPLPDDPLDLRCIIADLDRGDREAAVRGDRLIHSGDCTGDHDLAPDLDNLNILPTTFYVQAVQRMPPTHPLVKVLIPEITPRTFWGHPHVYPDGDICPLFAPDGGWDGRRNTIADFLWHVTIWLACHQVWCAMRRDGREARWIGERAPVPHNPADWPRLLRATDQCPCRSGLPYGSCHHPKAIGRRQTHALRPPHQTRQLSLAGGFHHGKRSDATAD